MVPGEEAIVSTRDMRVAVGEDLHVVDVKCGDPWPADARGRIDVLLRTGFVVRFLADGSVDPVSVPFVTRLGIPRPLSYPQRPWAQRSRELAQTIDFRGRPIRVFAGRPDGEERELFVHGGRAFGSRRGAPDPAGDRSLRSRGSERAARRPGPEKTGRRRRRIEG